METEQLKTIQRPQTLTTQAYQLLRQAILRGDFAPEQRLTEEGLAEQLKISRTPVREAVQKLRQEGLLVALQPRGVAVVAVSQTEIEQIFKLRLLLERYATEEAAQHIRSAQLEQLQRTNDTMRAALEPLDMERYLEANRTFHNILYTAADNPRLLALIDSLFVPAVYLLEATTYDPATAHEGWEGHQHIIEALKQADAAAAGQAMATHILTGQHRLTLSQKKSGNPTS
jgi:DNA-binding GntR family transcriptional regulator